MDAPGPSENAVKPKKRTFNSTAWELILKADDRFICNIDQKKGCRYEQARYEAGNFVRHFRLVHPDLARTHGFFTKDTEPPKKKRAISKRPVAIDHELIIHASIELVTSHNLPHQCFEWPALRKIWDPCCDALGITINRENIKTHVRAVVTKTTEWLINEMQGKLVSLKVDSAVRYGRHVLGVNVQYELDGVMTCRTLGKTNFFSCTF